MTYNCLALSSISPPTSIVRCIFSPFITKKEYVGKVKKVAFLQAPILMQMCSFVKSLLFSGKA